MGGKATNIGRMRHRVTVQTETTAVTATGGRSSTTWTGGTAIWVNLKPLSARRALDLGIETHNVNYEVTARYNAVKSLLTDIQNIRLKIDTGINATKFLNLHGWYDVDEKRGTVKMIGVIDESV